MKTKHIFFSSFSGPPGPSQQTSRNLTPKSLFPWARRDIPNVLAPLPARGRPPPHRKISRPKRFELEKCVCFSPAWQRTYNSLAPASQSTLPLPFSHCAFPFCSSFTVNGRDFSRGEQTSGGGRLRGEGWGKGERGGGGAAEKGAGHTWPC